MILLVLLLGFIHSASQADSHAAQMVITGSARGDRRRILRSRDIRIEICHSQQPKAPHTVLWFECGYAKLDWATLDPVRDEWTASFFKNNDLIFSEKASAICSLSEYTIRVSTGRGAGSTAGCDGE